MKEIVFVTTNKGKMATAQRHFKNIKLIGYHHELEELRSDNIEEIARVKVLQAYELVNKPCIALDSGFYIEALNGFPKAYVHFALDTLGVEGILRAMQGIENRGCCFKECLAYYDGDEIKFFYGEYQGVLSKNKKGKSRKEQWSDLWYVFIPDKQKKTLAEMDVNQRQFCSNQSRDAIKEFAMWYSQIT